MIRYWKRNASRKPPKGGEERESETRGRRIRRRILTRMSSSIILFSIQKFCGKGFEATLSIFSFGAKAVL
jgi:hypothetical protein